MDTLILNRDGNPLSLLPLSVIGWQTAVKLYYQDKVSVLHYYENWTVKSARQEWPVPSVVMMTQYAKWSRIVKYSRNNIFLRDEYICQLCNEQFEPKDLTLDHVVPRARGGKTCWTNIVAACKECNERKGDNHKIVPKKMPTRPSYYEMVAKRQKHNIVVKDKNWLNYITWPQDKIQLLENYRGKQ